MIDTICLSSGGINGYTFIGALLYLNKINYIDLNNIINYYGTSAGSIIAFLFILGYSPNNIINIVIKEMNLNILTNIDFDNLIVNYGLDNFDKITNILSIYLDKKLGVKDITFYELFTKTNKKFIINTTNFTKNCEELLSYTHTPNLSIIMGIKMSCSIPFVFEPVLYNDCHYMDGAIINTFLINHCNPNTTLGLFIYYKINNKLESITDLFTGLLNIVSNKNYNFTKYKIIKITGKLTNYLNSSEFNNANYIKKLFSQGYNSAKIFYIDELKNKISELKNNINQLTSKLNNPIDKLTSKLNDSINKLNDPTDELNSPIDELNSPIDELNSPIDELNSPIDELNGPIDELNSPTDELNSPTDELNGPIDELNSPIDELNSPIDELNSPTDELNGQIDELNNISDNKI